MVHKVLQHVGWGGAAAFGIDRVDGKTGSFEHVARLGVDTELRARLWLSSFMSSRACSKWPVSSKRVRPVLESCGATSRQQFDHRRFSHARVQLDMYWNFISELDIESVKFTDQRS